MKNNKLTFLKIAIVAVLGVATSLGCKKDQEKLYYAASYAVNGQDYDLALKHYEELKNLNYSGEKIPIISTKKRLMSALS